LRKALHSLKFQIGFAVAALALLFAGSTLYSLRVIDLQHSDDALVRLAGRLLFNQQHLTVQAMQYRDNAPRDYPSYNRDLRLYFQDLKRTLSELSEIIEAFSNNRFDGVLTGVHMAVQPQLPQRSRQIARDLGSAWKVFSAQLDERIGPDEEEPRLEWAAAWITEQHAMLEQISRELVTALESDVTARAARANLVNRVVLVMAIFVALGITGWFYRRVLAPLATAVEGFKKVANGDFSYKVPVVHNNEIGWLVEAFNGLSHRLDTLKRLLTRLEQGGDLESTLKILSETLPALIPVDWIGVLIVGVDGRIHLEKAFSDGKPDPIGQHNFEPDKTLLKECLESHQPLHVPDVREMARLSESYVFLLRLAELGRRDAIFLPVGSTNSIQGVVVFASRYPNMYRTEHLELLGNLGVLVGASLGRTIQLVENTRLATIGQFASGIVHEIRNPLATISLALEHIKTLEQLPPGGRKRADLAGAEVTRLERLLADILVYAKPLTLERSAVDLVGLVEETVAAESVEAAEFQVRSAPCPAVAADTDRLRQVLINLLRNARQASPAGSPVSIRCEPLGTDRVEVEIANQGEPIPEGKLERVFEPFFTSKGGGTGLGLAIVRRIVSAHGGEITLESDEKSGTRAKLRLPIMADASDADRDQAAVEAG
jgi:signal transduction histidine kinase/HAMP domain-containing protein